MLKMFFHREFNLPHMLITFAGEEKFIMFPCDDEKGIMPFPCHVFNREEIAELILFLQDELKSIENQKWNNQ